MSHCTQFSFLVCFFSNGVFFIKAPWHYISQRYRVSRVSRGEVREKEVSREEHDLDVGPMAVLSKGMRKDKKAVSFLDIWTKYNLSKYSS